MAAKMCERCSEHKRVKFTDHTGSTYLLYCESCNRRVLNFWLRGKMSTFGKRRDCKTNA